MSFIYTNVLFLMLIPALLLMFLLIKKKNNFEEYFSKEALEKLSVSNQYFSKKARNITLFISLIFMIIALARPVTNEKDQKIKQELNTLVVAIDVSKSMLATDLYPNRLNFATKKLLSIIENSKDTAIAVILFAKSSFILSPLTEDFHSLKILVENLDTGANFDNGTNIYSTLEVTNKLLKNSANKNLLLLTDGGDKKEFSKELDFANQNNINIYVIALASKDGSAIKLKDGNFMTNKNGDIVTVGLNENIKELALNTKGGFINYSLDDTDINAILNDILKTSKKQSIQSQKYKTYTELFYYPLALGIFLLLIAFSSLPKIKSISKKSNSLFILVFIMFLINDAKASLFDFQTIEKADNSYKKKEYEQASKEYLKLSSSQEQQYNLANSLYKEKKYKEAIKKYKDIKTQNRDLNFNKLHNLGNAYAKSNDLESAKKSYEEALKIKNDKETKENLDEIKKALEKKDKKKKQNSDQKKKNDKKQENKKKENKKQEKSNNSKENKKNKEKSKKEDNKKKENKKSNQKIDKKQISDKEEKRWLKQLENKKTKSLLKKIESSQEDDSINPW